MSTWLSAHPRRRALLAVVAVLTFSLIAAGAFVAVKLRTNITVLDVDDALAQQVEPTTEPADGAAEPEAAVEPPTPTQPMNILVMGSDTRQGQGENFGSAQLIEGARADTTLLVHLSADREKVTVVSIPRDLVVTVPECTMEDGTTTYPYDDRFNAAFYIGGPECTIRTVSELTGLPIHHFVVVDFTAFERTIDALGGVEVCLTRPVEDPLAGLDLPAGVSRVDGEQGLAFVRARSSLGDGSDLARIERQQEFLASLVREATSRELLSDPIRVFRSLDAATQSLTMDSELAWLPNSASIARSLAGVDPADVSFVTYPNVYNEGFVTVRPDTGPALLLTEVLAADAAWPLPASSEVVDLAPQQTAVTVVNATGRADQATVVGAALSQQGFANVALSTATPQKRTQVRYSTGNEQAAATVAAAVKGAKIVPDDSVSGVRLIVGERWTVNDLRSVRVAAPTADGAAPAASEPSVPSGDVDWTVPDTSLPQGGTQTADKATCAS